MKIKKPNLKERFNHPIHFEASLNRVINQLGGNINDADLIANWNNIVGDDIAKQIKIFKITKNKENRTITVKMISASSALLMSYSEKKILDKLNAYYGKPVISKIKFIK